MIKKKNCHVGRPKALERQQSRTGSWLNQSQCRARAGWTADRSFTVLYLLFGEVTFFFCELHLG